MGEAFNRAGHFLGSATGETKTEVLEKLLRNHGDDAAEIRIREAGAQTPMPKYRCHKEVWALKIAGIQAAPNPKGHESDGSRLLVPADDGYAPFFVSGDYMRKHAPKVGGYYVVYNDGYKSFSPADAFEEGYARI